MKRLIKKANVPTIDDFYNSLEYDYEDLGLQTVKVSDIVGMSYPRNEEYNDDFSPKVKDDRWIYQYELVQNDESIEPISLIQMPNYKYVIDGDGNHRLSVAKVCGLEYIDAYVFKMINHIDNVKKNDNDFKLEKLKNRYNEIWNKLRNDYDLTKQEITNLENELYQLGDKIEEIESK